MLSPGLLASIRVGVDTLRANPLRTILSALGVIMGAGALVSVLSLGDGVEHYARRQIERTTDLHGTRVRDLPRAPGGAAGANRGHSSRVSASGVRGRHA